MAYTPTNWVNGTTVANATTLNNIETGISVVTAQALAGLESPLQPPAFGGEKWALSNFLAGVTNGNTTTLTPSLTANGVEQIVRTVMTIPEIAWRLEFDYANTIASGWWEISVALCDSAGVLFPGTDRQVLLSQNSPAPDNAGGHMIFELDTSHLAWTNSGTLDVQIHVWNNAPSGTLSLSNVTVKQVGSQTRPMLVTGNGAGVNPVGGFAVFRDQKDVRTNVWKTSAECFSFGTDMGSPLHVVGSTGDGYWLYPPADPLFLRAYRQQDPGQPTQPAVAGTTAQMRTVNNDQVLEVKPVAGANAGVFEYRCNVHGGETIRGATSFKIDQGAGLVAFTNQGNGSLTRARRVQVIYPTQVQGSTDSSPFAYVDHVQTLFPDGVTRMDRTTTFQRATELRDVYEWMSSHDTTAPRVGRLGSSPSIVGGAVDIFAKVAKPATPSTTTATTGGTLAAGTYSYRVSALSADGETPPSTAITRTTTGTTSTVTVSWTLVTNATGYVVYGRTAGYERALTVVGPAVTSYVDTGAAIPKGLPSDTNTAWLTGVSTDNETAKAGATATWAVWYDPKTGWAFGNIFDRDSILSRTGVTAARAQLLSASGIVKNYTRLYFNTASYTIPSGTVWTATHYSFTYLPADPANYHFEIAARAAAFKSLAAIYPNT